MSVRSEHWSPAIAPSLPESSLRDSSLGASGLPESSLASSGLVPLRVDAPRARWGHLRAISLPRAVGERRGGMFVAGMLAATGGFFVCQALLLDLGNVD